MMMREKTMRVEEVELEEEDSTSPAPPAPEMHPEVASVEQEEFPFAEAPVVTDDEELGDGSGKWPEELADGPGKGPEEPPWRVPADLKSKRDATLELGRHGIFVGEHATRADTLAATKLPTLSALAPTVLCSRIGFWKRE
jgi:hypothetical protein